MSPFKVFYDSTIQNTLMYIIYKLSNISLDVITYSLLGDCSQKNCCEQSPHRL